MSNVKYVKKIKSIIIVIIIITDMRSEPKLELNPFQQPAE